MSKHFRHQNTLAIDRSYWWLQELASLKNIVNFLLLNNAELKLLFMMICCDKCFAIRRDVIKEFRLNFSTMLSLQAKKIVKFMDNFTLKFGNTFWLEEKMFNFLPDYHSKVSDERKKKRWQRSIVKLVKLISTYKLLTIVFTYEIKNVFHFISPLQNFYKQNIKDERW